MRQNYIYTRTLCALFFFLQSGVLSFAQDTRFSIDESLKKMDAKEDSLNNYFWRLTVYLGNRDSTSTKTYISELEKKGTGAGARFNIRLNLVKAQVKYLKFEIKDEKLVGALLKAALMQSYEINDPILAALASRQLGEMYYVVGKLEPAAMYCLNAVELLEKSNTKIHFSESYTYWTLGEILYHTGEYAKGIDYTFRAFHYGLDSLYGDKTGEMMGWSTIGMCYQELGNYDSAMIAFDSSLHIARKINNQLWKGIASGNKGKIYFLEKNYTLSKPLLEYDYQASEQKGIHDNAGYSLEWIARLNYAEGKKDEALAQLKQAVSLLQFPTRQPYLIDIYKTISEVYDDMGKKDSFRFYNKLYTRLHDSLVGVKALSKLEFVSIKLAHEQNLQKIQSLQKEKESEELRRNFVIAAIMFLATIIILLLNRQRLRSKYSQQLAMQQKAAADTEISFAREQLNSFTLNIIEKTAIIEKLEQQLQNKTISIEQQELINELSHQTILTEEDWEKFKFLFEKIYPGFFIKIKKIVFDITLAEQRMAALIRLQLTTREMATMLGISPNSVNKTKQRLRLRFNNPPETNIEALINEL